MNAANEIDLLAVRNDTFLRDVQFHEETESTNTLALELAKTDCESPLVVIARRHLDVERRLTDQAVELQVAINAELKAEVAQLHQHRAAVDVPVNELAGIGMAELARR